MMLLLSLSLSLCLWHCPPCLEQQQPHWGPKRSRGDTHAGVVGGSLRRIYDILFHGTAGPKKRRGLGLEGGGDEKWDGRGKGDSRREISDHETRHK